MQLLLTGATGLIGGRLLDRLAAAGHSVVCAGRSAPAPLPAGCRWLEIDLAQAGEADWLPHLAGVQAVVNCVGIFREAPGASFRQLHADGPAALFRACVQAGVGRVLHFSALGADARASTAYHRSKHAGDRVLMALPLAATVLQPSLVFDLHGQSSGALLTLATLPLLVLPDGGRHPVQPVHIDDVCDVVLALLQPGPHPPRVALVGPRPLALADYLLQLRGALGLRPLRVRTLPAWATALAAAIGEHWPGALFNRDALAMLRRGNTAPVAETARVLGHAPRPVARFIAPQAAAAARQAAAWRWLQPLLRLALACVWLLTAWVSVAVYPLADSLDLLARAGVPAQWQAPALWGAAGLDLLLGLATLWPGAGRQGRLRWLWPAQAALILGYSAIITLRLPEFWAHPYGPLSKNLPMLALLLLLFTMDAARPASPPSARTPAGRR